MIEHYIVYLYPGSFFSEETEKKVKVRDNIRKFPRGCFGYRYYDMERIKGERGKWLTSETFNVSGTYYSGEIYTQKQLEKEFPKERVLISNMKNNRWYRMIRTSQGNFQAFEKKDILVTKGNKELEGII